VAGELVGHIAIDSLHPGWQRGQDRGPPVERVGAVVLNLGITVELQARAIPAGVDEVGRKKE